MAQGSLRDVLAGSVASVTNPTDATSGGIAVQVGDLVFATMSQQTNLTATGCTDNLGNTYNAVNAGTDAGTVSIRSFYARVTTAGTLTVVHFAASASTNDASVIAAVIEGPFLTSPLDANPANATDATTPFTCPSTGTLAQASEVVMAAIAVAGNQTVAATAPSSLAGVVARANASVGQSRRVVSSTASVTPEFTGTSVTAAQVTASFKLDPNQTLTASLFTDSDTFHAPTVTPGAVDLTPSLYADFDTFHAPTVTTTYALTADLYSDDDIFHAPTVTPGAITLSPPLHTDDDTFYAPTVSQEGGGQTLEPALYEDADTFHVPTVSSVVNLVADLWEDPDAFYAPTVSIAALTLEPSIFVETNTFHAPTVTATYPLTAALFADSDAFHAPSVTFFNTLTPALYIDSDVFYEATLSGGIPYSAPGSAGMRIRRLGRR